MHDVVMVGASHDVAALHTVGALAVRAGQLSTMLESLGQAGCVEAAVLSTCSRTEIYAVLPDPGWADALLDVLLAPVGRDATALRERTSRRSGREVEAHLFRVAAGLDSRIAGEVEIQGQVRSAARAAEDHGTMGPRLRALFGAAVATARRAHRETALATLGRSVGRTAVDTALEGLSARPTAGRSHRYGPHGSCRRRSARRARHLACCVRPIGRASRAPEPTHSTRAWDRRDPVGTACGRRRVLRDVGVESSGDGYRGAARDANARRDGDSSWSICRSRPTSSRARARSPECASSTSMTFETHPRHLIAWSSTPLWMRPKRSWRRRCDASTPPAIVVWWAPSSCRCSRVPKRRIGGRFGSIDRSWWWTGPSIRWRERSPVVSVHHCIIDVREAAQRDDVDAIERILRSITDHASLVVVSSPL